MVAPGAPALNLLYSYPAVVIVLLSLVECIYTLSPHWSPEDVED